ncbi:MAG: tryptophan synthase subunit alpha [bacterium]
MNRLAQLFRRSDKNQDKLLSLFLTAGYPKLESTPELVWTVERAGADFVEIGIPFSDPLADGPTIQKSSQTALQNGMNVRGVLQQVEEIRRKSQLPLILMTYLNPILKYGLEKFIEEANEAGVDGFIIPDLLPEELETARNGKTFGVNLLISPNTPIERVRAIDRLTTDFIYCVSVTGVTGSRRGVPAGLLDYLKAVREVVTHPVLVGFGVSDPEDAGAISRAADGVIIGSALIDLMGRFRDRDEMLGAVSQFVQKINQALKGAR